MTTPGACAYLHEKKELGRIHPLRLQMLLNGVPETANRGCEAADMFRMQEPNT